MAKKKSAKRKNTSAAFRKRNKTQKKNGGKSDVLSNAILSSLSSSLSSSHKSNNSTSVQKIIQNIEQKKIDTHNRILSQKIKSIDKIQSQSIDKTKTKKAANKIKQFIAANLLKTVCSDAGVCMAFGQKRDIIKKFFEGFTTFEYTVSPMKMIGEPSSNGFIREIQYRRLRYKSFAILKSSKRPNADNLVYEFIVGQYINSKCKLFPCFVETYGLYYYKNKDNWMEFSQPKSTITANYLKESLELEKAPYNYSKMCMQSQYATILTEHIKAAKSFNSYMYDTNKNKSMGFIIKNMVYVLYQIYMPLAILQDNFTHYDLHAGNVLLYKPVEGKYIEYHYHIESGVEVNFKSQYIAKIIDYGRCYYKFGDKDNRPESALEPLDIYETLCQERECSTIINKRENICGSKLGFGWLEPVLSSSKLFISSSESNPSHDLRLLYVISDEMKFIYEKLLIFDKDHSNQHKYLRKTIELLMNRVFLILNYGIDIKKEEDKIYGTKPNDSKGYPFEINNVRDAEEALRTIILDIDMKEVNDNVFGDPNDKLGDMHIYSDGTPMKFIPVEKIKKENESQTSKEQ